MKTNLGMNDGCKRWTRRDFIKIAAVAGTALTGVGMLRPFRRPAMITTRSTRLLMGTVIEISLVAASEAAGQTAIETAFATMTRLTHLFNYRETAGPLGELNHSGSLENAPAELIRLLESARSFSEISGGAFDVTVLPALEALQSGRIVGQAELERIDYRQVDIQASRIKFKLPGMRITLDGIAKGEIVDHGVAALQKLGYKDILVDAGGDILAYGTHTDGRVWKIGVANPRITNGNPWLATLPLAGRAVATSGDYMQTFTQDYSLNHIIDPRRGLSPAELSSATVIAPCVRDADALATGLMVLGVQQGLALVARLPGIEALLATKDLQIFRSDGFPAA